MKTISIYAHLVGPIFQKSEEQIKLIGSRLSRNGPIVPIVFTSRQSNYNYVKTYRSLPSPFFLTSQIYLLFPLLLTHIPGATHVRKDEKECAVIYGWHSQSVYLIFLAEKKVFEGSFQRHNFFQKLVLHNATCILNFLKKPKNNPYTA